jgi:hypothetical protein
MCQTLLRGRCCKNLWLSSAADLVLINFTDTLKALASWKLPSAPDLKLIFLKFTEATESIAS